MSNIQYSGYNTLEEFQRDFLIYKNNPNDKVFARAVTNKIFNSSDELVRAIKYEMLNSMMETDPKGFVKIIANHAPKGYMVFVKSKEDPFFEV